jgi:hypothetical protein
MDSSSPISTTLASLMTQYSCEDGKLSGIPQEKLLEAIMALQSMKSDTSSSKKPRKSKSTKDPNKPKRGKTAYIIWLSDNRRRIKEELVDKADDVDVKPTEVVKEGGRQWKLLDADEKAPFEERATIEKERYDSEMETYQPSESVVVYTVDDYPSAPKEWSGPYQLKYLSGNAKSLEGKNLSFKSFDEAVESASKIDGCGGITKTARGYSLRVGHDLLSTREEKASSGLASWIKGNPETFVSMTETKVETIKKPKAKVDTIKKPKAKAKAKAEVEGEAEAEAEAEVEDEAEAEEVVSKTKSSPKKKNFKTKEPEVVEVESEDEESEDDEDEEVEEDLDVDEVVIDGDTYFKTADGTLYDPDTQKIVGKSGKLFE